MRTNGYTRRRQAVSVLPTAIESVPPAPVTQDSPSGKKGVPAVIWIPILCSLFSAFGVPLLNDTLNESERTTISNKLKDLEIVKTEIQGTVRDIQWETLDLQKRIAEAQAASERHRVELEEQRTRGDALRLSADLIKMLNEQTPRVSLDCAPVAKPFDGRLKLDCTAHNNGTTVVRLVRKEVSILLAGEDEPRHGRIRSIVGRPAIQMQPATMGSIRYIVELESSVDLNVVRVLQVEYVSHGNPVAIKALKQLAKGVLSEPEIDELVSQGILTQHALPDN